MRNITLSVCLLLLPLIANAQISDSSIINSDINKLIQLNYTLINEEKYDEALECIRKAEESCLLYFGDNSAYYATILDRIGTIFYYTGRTSKVESLWLKAKDIREEVLGSETAEYASSLNNLGVFYWANGQNEKAKPYFLQARSLWEELVGKEHPDYAASLMNLGALYWGMGFKEKAEPYFLEAKSIWTKVLSGERPNYTRSLFNLEKVFSSLNHSDKASAFLLEGSDFRKNLIIKAAHYLSERELGSFISTFASHQDKLFSFANSQEEISGDAYDNSLFYKGFLLMATQQVSRLAQKDSSNSKQFHQIKNLKQQLAKAYSSSPDDRDTSHIAKLEERANDLERELIHSVAGYEEAIKQVSWQEVQSKLKNGEAALEFVDYKYHNPNLTDSIMYAAILIRPADVKPLFIPLFEKRDLEDLIGIHLERRADYVNDLYTVKNRGAVALSSPKKSLFDIIWKPIENKLADSHTIYFSPSGLLHRINFSAIPIDHNASLNDKYNLIRLNSTRSLVIESEGALASQTAFVYGGIEYNPDTSNSSTLVTDFKKINADTSFRGESWNYLSWTKTEMEEISTIMINNEIIPLNFSSFSATEESFKDISTYNHSPQILHLATHGFFFSNPETKANTQADSPTFKISDNPMFRSGLLLAGANYAWQGKAPLQEKEDGILTSFEISQVDLSQTELVVLSACETGLGDIKGNEGVYGLQRAFKIAGAKYIIMSLWQVPDRQTKDFMVSFYKHWLEDKFTISEAFNKTQEQMKNRFYDPYLWAGFVLVE